MYSTYNAGNSVVAGRIIRMLKNRIFKHMTTVSNVYFYVLYDIGNKYNNAVHKIMKIKPVDVTSHSYVKYKEDSNVTKPKFKVGDHVRISKYKNIFAKGYTQIWSKNFFIISKIKNTLPWTYVIGDLNVEAITESFYEKESKKTNQGKFKIEKVIKRKGDKLYVKWKGYYNSFNIWIDEMDLD